MRTFHTLREVARRHYVSFLTFIQHPEEWDGLSVLREFCEDVVALPIPADAGRGALAQSLVANIASRKPYVAQKYDTRAMRRAIRDASAFAPVDLLHLDMLPLAVYANEAGHAPVILVDHNVEYVLAERRAKTETGLSRRFWAEQARRVKSFEEAAVRRATRTVAVSDVDAEILRKVPGAEVRVVPNGVDVQFFQPDASPVDSNEIVFVGAMTYHPNVDSVRFFCEEVWPKVRQAMPQAHFTVIGAHPPDNVTAYGKTPGVTVAGQVPDIRPYVSKAAVYVVPLRIGGGTRLKILDAMAMGKAIVSTAVGCEGLEVTEGKDIIVADRAEDFASRVIELMRDAGLRERLGCAGRVTVESKYTWESIGVRQEEVYQEACAAKAAD